MLSACVPLSLKQPSAAMFDRWVVPKTSFVACAKVVRRQKSRHKSGQCHVVSWQTTEVLPHKSSSVKGSAPTARITFKTQRRLQYGQVLKLVGSHKGMGRWDASKAPAMTWTKGDYWVLTLDLPAGEHEFKVIVVHSNGDGGDWEPGPNRVLQVPEAEAAVQGTFTVMWDWGNPKVMPEEEHELEELKQLMEALEQGWEAGTSTLLHPATAKPPPAEQKENTMPALQQVEAANKPLQAAEPLHHVASLQSHDAQQLSELLEAERAARRAAEAERDELLRQAKNSAAEAAVLVRNSAKLRAEFDQLSQELGDVQDLRAQLQAERDRLAAELHASPEQRAVLQRERDALAEQVWLEGEQRAQRQPEKEMLEARVRGAEEQVMQLQQERDALANQLVVAREQLAATEREARRWEEEVRQAGRHHQVLKSVGLLLATMD